MNLTPEQVKELQKKIADLVAERDNYIVEANRQIAAYNGAIQTLQQMLPQPKPLKGKSPQEGVK